MPLKKNTEGWNNHDNDHSFSDVESKTTFERSGQVVQITSPLMKVTRNDQGIFFEGPLADLFSVKRKPGEGSTFFPHKK